MKFEGNQKMLFFFIQLFVAICCAYFTVSYIFYGKVSYIKAVIFSLLFAGTNVFIKRKKQARNHIEL
jgi:hypothetical protein